MDAPNTIKKEVTLRFRATIEEKKRIVAAARLARQTLSEYVRGQALGQPVLVVEQPREDGLSGEQRRALIGMATNLNQAMRLSNAGQYATQDLLEVIAQIKAALQ